LIRNNHPVHQALVKAGAFLCASIEVSNCALINQNNLFRRALMKPTLYFLILSFCVFVLSCTNELKIINAGPDFITFWRKAENLQFEDQAKLFKDIFFSKPYYNFYRDVT